MPKETKATRLAAAREKAAEARELRLKKAKRNRILLQGGIIVGAIAIIAIIALIIITVISSAAVAAPRNMQSDGITITKGLVAERTVAQKDKPVATKVKSDKVQIKLYVDYQCPVCKAFEAANAKYLGDEINTGKVEVEIHPIAFLSAYSQRAASAAACVADTDPDKYWAYNTALYDKQPDEGTSGLTYKQLAAIAKTQGITKQKTLNCITAATYTKWSTRSTTLALNNKISNSNVAKVTGTPTVIVDGKSVDTTTALNNTTFRSVVEAALGAKKLT